MTQGESTMGTRPADEYDEANTGHTPDTVGVPVPVRVTDPVRVEENPPRSIATDQVPVDVHPTRILPVNIFRATVTLQVHGGDCWIGNDQVTPGTGFLLANGSGLVYEATGPLYAVAAAAGVVTVHTFTQQRDGR